MLALCAGVSEPLSPFNDDNQASAEPTANADEVGVTRLDSSKWWDIVDIMDDVLKSTKSRQSRDQGSWKEESMGTYNENE